MEHLIDVILVTIFSVSLLGGATLLVSGPKDLSRRVLALAYLDVSFMFFCNYIYSQSLFELSMLLRSGHLFSVLVLFPLLYFYVKSKIDNSLSRSLLVKHLFIPFVFTVASSCLYFLGFSCEQRYDWLIQNYEHISRDRTFSYLLFSRFIYVFIIISQAIYYNCTIYSIIKSYHKVLEGNSLNKSYRFNSLFSSISITISAGIILFYITNVSFNVTDYFNKSAPLWLYFFYGVIVCFLWILFVGCSKDKESDLTIWSVVSYLSLKKKPQVMDKDGQLLKRLIDYINMESVFLNSELTLIQVSREVGSNRTYISRLFNEKLSTNFNTYLNDRRIEYARQLLKNDKVELSSLYIKCGYKSVSSFYQAFSSRVGTSPKKYQDKILNNVK